MSTTESATREPLEGQIWEHAEHEYSVVTTRITDTHIQYTIRGDESIAQADAAKEFLKNEFGFALAYVAPIGGSRLPRSEFTDLFVYVMDRPRNSYES